MCHPHDSHANNRTRHFYLLRLCLIVKRLSGAYAAVSFAALFWLLLLNLSFFFFFKSIPGWLCITCPLAWGPLLDPLGKSSLSSITADFVFLFFFLAFFWLFSCGVHALWGVFLPHVRGVCGSCLKFVGVLCLCSWGWGSGLCAMRLLGVCGLFVCLGVLYGAWHWLVFCFFLGGWGVDEPAPSSGKLINPAFCSSVRDTYGQNHSLFLLVTDVTVFYILKH